jgi:predicted nucleotidyltransferase
MATASPENRVHTIDELKLLVAPVAEKYGVAKVYLFGSVARGDHDENSDYDFCIESGKMRGLFMLSGFFRNLKNAVEKEIDIVDSESIEPEFLNLIMKEGVVLYEAQDT